MLPASSGVEVHDSAKAAMAPSVLLKQQEHAVLSVGCSWPVMRSAAPIVAVSTPETIGLLGLPPKVLVKTCSSPLGGHSQRLSVDDREALVAILTGINLTSPTQRERISRLGELRKILDFEISTAVYQAPAGQVYVCGACGRQNKNRTKVGDESCFLNAVLCLENSIERGNLVKAQAVVAVDSTKESKT